MGSVLATERKLNYHQRKKNLYPENYLGKIASIDINSMPMPLQKGHDFLMKATLNGVDWNTYNNSTANRKTIQLYFERLYEHLTEMSQSSKVKTKDVKNPQPQKVRTTTKPTRNGANIPNVIMVERMPEELRFIKRFVHLNGKTKTKDNILRFINSLQKAIVEK